MSPHQGARSFVKEPASERLDPQISTSIAWRYCRRVDYGRRKCPHGQPLGPESPSIRMPSGVTCGTLALSRPALRPAKVRCRRTGLHNEDRLSLSLMQRGAERKQSCDWHLCCALILRGRRLSARNLGPASPVEACHPQMHPILYRFFNEIQPMNIFHTS